MSYTLLNEREYYKPFSHPQFFERWIQHEKTHWMPEECSMQDDINDWKNKLNDEQRNFLTNIFRFFTQGDIDVAGAYVSEFLPYFPQIEVRMMMLSFAAREAIHIHAYSHLIESIGMPETVYKEFFNFNAMKAKHDYIKEFSSSSYIISKGIENLTIKDKEHIALGIALFSGFTEGMQLFSTFAMILMFPLHGLMKRMGQIITWSIRDETQHTNGMIEVFKVFLDENPDIDKISLTKKVYEIAKDMVKLEEEFINLVFKDIKDDFFGMTPEKLMNFVKYIADRRLITMGFSPLFYIKENPLPELVVMIDAPTHTNFFENNSTDYSLKSTTGDWSDVWS
ncbi:ribonucleoside-diphosphate reductase subunit beta [Spirochaetia bacterium]|nr:ribonucleoside-diphosphate reductase subunit beta [Spirochaetia bacterium]